MARITPPWVLAFVFVLAGPGLLGVQEAAAQLGTSQLSGMVCVDVAPYSTKYGGSCQGLPSATVRVQKTGVGGTVVGGVDKSATTDENGFYNVGGLDDGTYQVTATRAGFTSITEDVAVQGASNRDLYVPRQSVTQAGKLQDTADKPVKGGHVSFYPASGYESSVYAGPSAAEGTFSVTLMSGFYSMNAEAPGYRGAYDYRLVDGTGTLTFILEKVPPPDAKLMGTVTDQKGRPVEGVRIDAYSYGGPVYYEGDAREPSSTGASPPDSASYYPYYGGSNFTFTDSQGRYTLGVYAGSGSLNLQKQGYASIYDNFQVESRATDTRDFEMQKYPDKTAVLKGTVRSSSGAAVTNLYLSANAPALGLYECSDFGQTDEAKPMPAGDAMTIAPGEPYPYYPGCAIHIQDDGSFEGRISPGYTIVQAYGYQDCFETGDSGGDFRRECGPEFFPWVRTLILPDNATTELEIILLERPGPDATLSGYVVDAETKKAIAHARVSFSRLDGYGYGDAETDGDGSYKLRLRSGLHNVYVWADDHLHWEGQIDVPAGDAPFDVELTRGNEAYGYCCHVYASSGGGFAAEDKAMGAPASSGAEHGYNPGVSPQAPGQGMPAGVASGDASFAYRDLGGGLGPYNAAARQNLLGAEDGSPSPSGGLLMLGALVAMALFLRRRMA